MFFFRAKKNVQSLPESHFVEHRLVRTNINKDARGNTVELVEDAVASYARSV